MDAEIRIIACIRTPDNPDIELRFIRSEYGWIPDLVIDHAAGTVSKPPGCFDPIDEVIDALNEATFRLVGDILPPVGAIDVSNN
jgi:hypothetical protein